MAVRFQRTTNLDEKLETKCRINYFVS